MKAINLNTGNAQILATSGNREFVHIQNLGPGDCYVCYDGDDAINGFSQGEFRNTGIKIPVNSTLMLNNDGTRPIFQKTIYGLEAAGSTAVVRIQGGN